MFQLQNSSPFAASIALFPDLQGVDTLYTMVKGSFRIGRQWTLLEKQPDLRQQDQYWDAPDNSSLRYISDYHTGKSATDIIVTGAACAPQMKPVKQLHVQVAVGEVSTALWVVGDRYWRSGVISEPEPFTTMPLVYERAFGGVDMVEGTERAVEERNPVGKGFAGKKSASEAEGMPLPNLECPQQLIRHFKDAPTPVCFAPIAGHWLPRRIYAGTYDEVWQRTRAPYLPEDYSPRFMNAAHPLLIYPGYVKGGENVRITGMHPAGALEFQLPVVNLVCNIQLEGEELGADFSLETVEIQPNDLQVSLTWRSEFRCDKRAAAIKTITVNMAR